MGASLKKIINSLKNHFLVAMPGLHDENFSGSVVYICEHNAEGAMGLIINQQLDIPAKAVFDRLDLEHTNDQGDELIFDGGPVQRIVDLFYIAPAIKSGNQQFTLAAALVFRHQKIFLAILPKEAVQKML